MPAVTHEIHEGAAVNCGLSGSVSSDIAILRQTSVEGKQEAKQGVREHAGVMHIVVAAPSIWRQCGPAAAAAADSAAKPPAPAGTSSCQLDCGLTIVHLSTDMFHVPRMLPPAHYGCCFSKYRSQDDDRHDHLDFRSQICLQRFTKPRTENVQPHVCSSAYSTV